MRILAYDFECVLDSEAGRKVYGFDGTDVEVRAQMKAARLVETDGKSDFAKPAFWQVVAVGFVLVDTSAGVKVSLMADAGRQERSLLALTNVWFDRRPKLLSWNGGGYDLPVLRYRSLIHGVSQVHLYGPESQKNFDSYQYRFGEAHIDLMDLLAGYGASKVLKLSEVARLCGLPTKTITDGSGVEDLVEAQEWPAIKSYVLEDSLIVALLFLRFELSRGRLTRAAFHEILVKINDALSMDHIAVSAAITGWLNEAKAATAEKPEPVLALGVA